MGATEALPIDLSCRIVIRAIRGPHPMGNLSVVQFGCPAEL